MNLEVIRHFLLWCTIVNYGVLLLWFVAFVAAHDAMLGFMGGGFASPVINSTPYTTPG